MKKSKNQLALENLKKNPKFKDLDISKPVYPDGYWDEVEKLLKSKDLVFNETNNTSK